MPVCSGPLEGCIFVPSQEAQPTCLCLAICLKGQFKSKLDELGNVSVTMIKGEMPQHDGQPGLRVADGADPPFDVLDVVAQHRLVREYGRLRLRPLAHGGDYRIGTVGEDLKGQIPGLLLRPGVRKAEEDGAEKAGEEKVGFSFHAVFQLNDAPPLTGSDYFRVVERGHELHSPDVSQIPPHLPKNPSTVAI